MKHLTHIELRNYRSFLSASCRLSPLTLVVGRNNSGKTNFLRAFQDFVSMGLDPHAGNLETLCHHQTEQAPAKPVKAQWKDLDRTAREACGHERDAEFYDHAARAITEQAGPLADKSDSFHHFREQLQTC